MLDPGVTWVDETGVSAGLSLTPQGMDDAKGAWGRATYSLGYRNQSGYMLIDDGAISSSTWSFGWSLPMLGSRSGSSLNATMTWQSTSAEGTATTFGKNGLGALIGFTLHPFFKNQWLVPRRYD